ncbi:rod shape-determining protein MreD [Geopsychrobacter electrodiphilus]|uniref:rod shape-determining protein MreD n=1 Tax=Geopsychrobacter electrodiphilus TaxID=225196 RepID=UPI00036F99FA|nr:rod shape-determining protein MreD [Geopsychrobacter electrodiphilus]
MRGLFSVFLCGLMFILLQTTIFPRFLSAELRPNLLLLLVIYLGLSESFLRAAILALLLGALQDVFSGTTFGLYATVQLTIFLVVRLFSDRLNAESRRLILGMVVVGTLIQTFVLGFLLTIFAEAGAVVSILLADLPFQLLSNVLTAWLLLLLWLRFQPLIGTRSGMAGLLYQSKHHGT